MEKLHLLCLLLTLVLLLQGALGDECDTKWQSMVERLMDMSHYEGPQPTPTTMTQMDDMDRKRKRNSDGTELPKNCFRVVDSALEVNCDSHQCISLILDITSEYDDLFEDGKPCQATSRKDQENDQLIEKLHDLSKCNQCVVHYTMFTKLEDELKATSCYPSPSHYTCKEDCFMGLEMYTLLHTEMLEGICRMYNPGGCGDMGGMTEGDIYDLVNGLGNEVARVETALAICSASCEKPMISWYEQWKPLVQKGCISTEDVDLLKDTTFLDTFNLDLQCDGECRTEVSAVVKSFYSTPSHCRKGLINDHISELTNSINFDRCQDDTGGASLSVKVIARAFFTLCLLSVGVFFIYLFSSMAYNRCVKGKKGWDAVPPIFCCKKCFPSSSSSSKKNNRRTTRDEEEVVLYDADDFDDDGL